MRIVLIGQQAFGKAVLEAFLARGEDIAGVFCTPEKPGSRPDVLRLAARERGLGVLEFASLRSPQASEALAGLNAQIAIMAYVLQFASQEFVTTPRYGTIQYHPSLLPRYRGPSSINWPIIRGEAMTGLTIFRPTDRLDEGPIVLQKTAAIGPDDTLGTVYFERLFPMGVQALLQAADLVLAGGAKETVQDDFQASYEGWCRAGEAQINWHYHLDFVYNLVRGCNPAPGAWTTLAGRKLQIFDARKHPARSFAQVKGKPGQITQIGQDSMHVSAHGGQLEVFKVKAEGGKKMSAAQFCADAPLTIGTVLGAP